MVLTHELTKKRGFLALLAGRLGGGGALPAIEPEGLTGATSEEIVWIVIHGVYTVGRIPGDVFRASAGRNRRSDDTCWQRSIAQVLSQNERHFD
jgi:hypothetical protein